MPLNIDFQQIFLHLFNFVLLGGGLYLLLYKPVVEFMDKRQAYYESLESDKKQALQQAQEKEELYTKKLDEFDQDMAAHKAEAIKECEKLVNARIESAKEQADKIVKDAQVKAEIHRDKMVEQAKEEITDLALSTAKKMMEQEDMYSQFVKAANEGEQDE
ncbi:ATP synthase F0 subunit B [Floccifex sp.]|uniref:ATP synthase F0 subunit B n=1 Tax=Floccifex sp. TaxID=2815810 RepID=UPI002A75E0BC|nr:ATP synthase F0 subunit B [Floccifex sp.]MDD7281231.1 ATP synthase F0 subunit B [Erysipelotrichaceae bacterium]MDY2958231.1 ATP synthase F0 subunit B [Floccifex sp.]